MILLSRWQIDFADTLRINPVHRDSQYDLHTDHLVTFCFAITR